MRTTKPIHTFIFKYCPFRFDTPRAIARRKKKLVCLCLFPLNGPFFSCRMVFTDVLFPVRSNTVGIVISAELVVSLEPTRAVFREVPHKLPAQDLCELVVGRQKTFSRPGAFTALWSYIRR